VISVLSFIISDFKVDVKTPINGLISIKIFTDIFKLFLLIGILIVIAVKYELNEF